MTERVYLHIGPHKTGTTYIQSLLMANRERLAEQGLLFVGGTFAAQGRAVRELLGGKAMPTTGRDVEGEWAKAQARMADWDGSAAVISHETLSGATPAQIGDIHDSLQSYDVHVVYTARDLARVVPAMWQTGLRSRQDATWEEYAASLRRPGPARRSIGRRFWQNQDAPAMLERWSKRLPAHNLHVVTVPRPGNPPELLWQRVCTVLGVDPAGHDLTPRRSNPSLGTAEAELLRRVNEALADNGVNRAQWLYWSRWLGRQLETREQMASYTLPDDDLGWLTRRANKVISGLRDGGYDIVGDLDDLVPEPVPRDKARHPSDTTPEDVLGVAVDALRRLVAQLAEQGKPGRGGPDDDV